LCLARDIASSRGATLTAICEGEEASHDALVVAAAGRFGADLLAFVGKDGLRALHQRLSPKLTMAAATPHSLGLLKSVSATEPARRWLSDPAKGLEQCEAELRSGAMTTLAIVAGSPPWIDLQTSIEADYEAGVDHTNLPTWLTASSQWPKRTTSLVYGGPLATSERNAAELSLFSGQPYLAARDDEAILRGDTLLLWLGADVPAPLLAADGLAQILVIPGQEAQWQESWGRAQWVLAGRPDEALRLLHGRVWRDELAL
jgi:hypothetical protein